MVLLDIAGFLGINGETEAGGSGRVSVGKRLETRKDVQNARAVPYATGWKTTRKSQGGLWSRVFSLWLSWSRDYAKLVTVTIQWYSYQYVAISPFSGLIRVLQRAQECISAFSELCVCAPRISFLSCTASNTISPVDLKRMNSSCINITLRRHIVHELVSDMYALHCIIVG